MEVTKRLGDNDDGASPRSAGSGCAWLRFASVLRTKSLPSLARWRVEVSAAIIFSLISVTGFCQTHLKPARYLSSSSESSRDYYASVFHLLQSNIEGETLVRYTVLPSFSSEYLLSLQKHDSTYSLVSHNLSESYWSAGYEGKTQDVKVIEERKLVDKDLAMALERLINTATKHIQKQEDLLGFDGETYLFTSFATKKDSVIGEASSPSKSSTLGKLVGTLEDLRAYVDGNGKTSSELIAQMQALTKEL